MAKFTNEGDGIHHCVNFISPNIIVTCFLCPYWLYSMFTVSISLN